MPDVPVALVPWFDAKDNPPDERTERDFVMLDGGWHGWFDRGTLVCDTASFHDSEPITRTDVYAEWPRVPDPDGLTLADLRNIGIAASLAAKLTRSSEDAVTFEALAGKLRRALDQIGTE